MVVKVATVRASFNDLGDEKDISYLDWRLSILPESLRMGQLG